MNRTGILIYHDIVEEAHGAEAPEKDFYAVRASEFDSQLDYLTGDRYRVITIDDYLRLRDRPAEVNSKYVVLSFDDGWRSHYTTVFPALTSRGLKAEFFVTVDRLGTEGFMTWDEAREMADAGMSIGSHTLTHPHLDELTDAEQEREIAESRQRLADGLGCEVRHLSLPSGRFNESTFGIAQRAGYATVSTSEVGRNSLAEDPFFLKRICIRYNTDIDTYRRICEGDTATIAKYRLKSTGSRFLRRFIGPDNIESIKRLIIKKQ